MYEKIFSKQYFFIAMLIFCFVKSFSKMWSLTSIFTYLLFFYGVIVAFRLIFNHYRNKRMHLYFFSITYILIMIVSIILNGYDDLGYIKTNFVLYFINLFVLLIPDKTLEIKPFSNYIILFLNILIALINILCIIYIMLRIYSLYFGQITLFERYAGEFQHPNYPGWYSLIAISSILLLYSNQFYNIKFSAYYLFSLCCNSYMLVVSGCRSAYFGVVILLVIIFLTNTKNYVYIKKYRHFTFFISFLFLIISAIVLIYAFGRGTSSRTYIYRFAIYEYFKKNKIFGIGCGEILATWKKDFDSFALLFPEFNVISRHIYEFNTHNVFLHELCLHGFLGFSFFLLINIIVIKKLYKLFCKISEFDRYTKFIFMTILIFYMLPLIISNVDDIIFSNIIMYLNCIYFFSISFLENIYEKHIK